MQGHQATNARPPLAVRNAVLTYTPDEACLVHSGVHCPSTVLCQHATPCETVKNLLFEKHLT